MKKAVVTLLIVLLAVSAVFAVDFEIKVDQGFLKANTYVPGTRVTTATVAVNNKMLEFGVTGSTVFPYAFFANAFTNNSWNTKWDTISAQTKNYWAVSAYAAVDVVRIEQVDLNLGVDVAYRSSNLATAPQSAVTASAKADATFWIADFLGFNVGAEFPVLEGVKNDSKWNFQYLNSMDQLKKFADITATTVKAGLTVRL